MTHPFSCSPDPKDTFAKLLFPSFVAGLIIGKEGAVISELMHQTETNVKFSPGRELYPGTQDRVCVVSGQTSNISTAVKGIMEKIKSSATNHDQECTRSLKMLVSNIASGMVIGKSGSTVRMIQQDCGVRIQISNKEEGRGLPERTMTISADNLECILSAFQNILERIIGDPESEKWRRLVSYSGHTPHASLPTSSSSIPTIPSNPQGAVADYSPFQAFLNPAHQSFTPPANSSLFPLMGAGVGSSSNFLRSGSTNSTSAMLSNPMLSHIYSQSLLSTGSSRFPPVMIDGVNLSEAGATLATYEVAIPEVMVTAIFGAGLKQIADIMTFSGSRLQLSSKGDFIPGTYNRKLTIVGPVLSVQTACFIVMQNIVKEQDSFRKQGLI